MSTRQSACAAELARPFPGPPSEPIPPLPPSRSLTDPIRAKPLPLVLPSSVSSSDLSAYRDPPIDPRKARRRCANFGFSREPLLFNNLPTSLPSSTSSDEEILSSPGPTPPGTFTSTSSDVSSFSDLPFDFPQPPPISPVLRRMKSSPLFTLPNTDSKRWALPQPTTVKSGVYQNKAAADSLTDLEVELDFAPPFDHSGTDSYRGRIDGLTRQLQSVFDATNADDLEPPLPPWTFRRDSDFFRDQPPFTLPAASQSSLLLGKAPLRHHHPHSRSEPFPPSSSESTSEPHSQSNNAPPRMPPRQISKMRSLKFAPESSSPLERLESSLPNQATKPCSSSSNSKSLFRGRSISMDFNKTRPVSMMMSTSRSSKDSSSSHLPRLGEGRVPQRVQTDPLIRTREWNSSLSTPFLHRPVASSTPVRAPSHTTTTGRSHQSMMGMRSFIDITPERQVQRKGSLVANRGDSKVKRLLSRASQMFDWKKKKANTNIAVH